MSKYKVSIKRKRMHLDVDEFSFECKYGKVTGVAEMYPNCCGIASLYNVAFSLKDNQYDINKLYNEFNKWLSGKLVGHLNRSILLMADNTRKPNIINYGKMSKFCTKKRGWFAIESVHNPWSGNKVRLWQKHRKSKIMKPQGLYDQSIQGL